MKIPLICILLAFHFISCKEREAKPELLNKDSIDVIIDYFQPLPFEIAKKPPAIVPDSLGGENIEGFVLLIIYIDSTGTLEKYDILKMKALNKKGNTQIDYYNTQYPFTQDHQYPEDVVRYMDWIEDYLQSLVFVKKNENIQTSKINRFSLMVRFNQ